MLFLAGCAMQENNMAQNAAVKINEQNISYQSDGIAVNGIECSPKNAGASSPAIVLTGGDGVDLEMLKPVCEAFAGEGLVALAHDNVNGTAMGNIDAVATAVDWLRKDNGTRKVSLWAHSSGTIFSFFAAYERRDISAFVETSGHFQIPICDSRATSIGDGNCDAYLDEFPAPILIVHGMNDSVVPVQFAYAFSQRLGGVNKTHEMIIVPGAKHEFMNERAGVISKEAEFIKSNSE